MSNTHKSRRTQDEKNYLKEYITYFGDTHNIMVIIIGSGLGYPRTNPEVVICISHSINILGKGMKPNMGK